MFWKPQKSAWQMQQERSAVSVERNRATRKLYAKEHKNLDKRPVEHWGHSDLCRPCAAKRRR